MISEPSPDLSARIFSGDSQLAQLMRSHNWADTSLGAIEQWSPSLCTAVSICLNSRFPMVIWWGRELVLLYNDAWLPIVGGKHPDSLGRPGHQVWAETWDVIGTQLNGVLETGKATWSDDSLLQLYRYGYLEETYFTYSYSPIFLECGKVGGAFTAVTETTDRVIGERRLATLRDLAAQTGAAKTIEQACQISIDKLANNLADIPFAAIYIVSETVTLKATTETELPLNSHSIWKLEEAIEKRQPILIENLAEQFGDIPAGVLRTPLQQALVLPIWASGQEALSGLLVVGVNPGRELDEDYRDFFEMAAGHIGTAIANADAYEAERKRVEALAELDRAKTEFFSNVSHEFRTPLTLMLNPLEEVLAVEPVEHREQLETAHRNGLRLLKLVNTLLDFSRIEAGRVQAIYQPIELSTFTAELASVFRTTIERVGLRLIVNCEGSEQAYVDREMWEKIVLNLISNAFKFTFEGEIEVSLRRVEHSIELNVRDTGVGIPSEALPRLFERFHRVSGTRSRSYEGSGIGLALVKELVTQHGGTISVWSEVNQGSTFTVKIPLGDAHLPPEQVDRDGIVRETTVRADAFVQEALRWNTEIADDLIVADSERSSTRILVVDDNADLRDYLKRLLSKSYRVETAIDGIDALNMIRQSAPDLILSDVMMPNLDGFGLLQELRSHPETKEIPIILLSARAGEEARVEGLGAGADDYLVKPFSARELMARVESTLKLSQLRQETTDRERMLRSQAERANRLKDEFLAVLSHELRTPLNPIMGWIKLLRSGKCSPAQTEKALETIERNAILQTQLIGDLLDVSRILQGKLNLAQEPINLSEIISAAIETVQLAADAKSLNIQTKIHPANPVIGDAGRLQQIVWNLLSNAVKFTPANGSITVSLTQIDGFAHLQVSDTGKGIQPSFLPYVFDYFRQEDGSSTRTFGGLGLGLAIVRYLTELHGGIVTAYSAGENQGATFTVKLPVVNRSIEPSEPLPNAIEQSLQGFTILVVDDDRDSNDLAAFVLQSAGASVMTASSGIEALQKLNTQIDLLVSDIGMPELDGYELLQQVRAQSIFIPAIALTAYAGGSDQQRAIKAGFQAHLAKPIEPDQLLSIAASLLKKSVESAPQSLQSIMPI
ncbi:multi-sensor hybrid histidine kinase [Leptolyngbya sp. NIES-3755]|nr:multi-sensor hybrid histidine kinase [Leptolyngbya sp. NIES-3755]